MTYECNECKAKMNRPSHLIISHRAEGIQVIPICNRMDCWISIGKKFVDGKR